LVGIFLIACYLMPRFQWQELRNLAESFGLDPAEAETGVVEMVYGAANTLFGSGMAAEAVMDLIPVKPLGEEEPIIRAMYKSRLGPLYEKLKN
jgi:pyrroline-5-carboxylate reductase